MNLFKKHIGSKLKKLNHKNLIIMDYVIFKKKNIKARKGIIKNPKRNKLIKK
jgi:hypothetical protein